MGTRSIVARPTGTGFAGRYIHWDGYPEGVGQELWQIVARDGLEKACKVLMDQHYSWSGIASDQPDLAGVEKDYDAPFGSPGYMAHAVGNDINVPGYGIAHADAQPDEFLTEETAKEAWCEWVYVLGPDALTVMQVTGDTVTDWNVCTFPWAGEEPDWKGVWTKIDGLKANLKGLKQ